MNNLISLVFLTSALLITHMNANSAYTDVQRFPASADVITVVSQPAIDNFEIFSLAKARQAIDETQARVQAEIEAHNSAVLTQNVSMPSSSDAS